MKFVDFKTSDHYTKDTILLKSIRSPISCVTLVFLTFCFRCLVVEWIVDVTHISISPQLRIQYINWYRLPALTVWRISLTSYQGNIVHVADTLCGESNVHRRIPLTKGQLHRALMFSLMCSWTNGWTNSGVTGSFGRYCALVMLV